jgi:hypothetical protein
MLFNPADRTFSFSFRIQSKILENRVAREYLDIKRQKEIRRENTQK